jgi:hypothetical protein
MSTTKAVQNPMMAAESTGDAIEELTDNLTEVGKEALSAGKEAAAGAIGTLGSLAVAGAGVGSEIGVAVGDAGAEHLSKIENAKDLEEGPSALLLTFQSLVTVLFGPGAFIYNITVLIDIFATSQWEFFSLEMLVLVIMPAMSFSGACYILVSYWMDQDSWSILRMRTMFASIPMCIFFGLMLSSQSKAHRPFDCETEAYIMQICYFMINMWQTMTVVTAYRFVCNGSGRFSGYQRVLVHAVCWGGPIILTTILQIIAPDAWHTDLFGGELQGIGWCGVKSDRRWLKAIFVNTPQLVAVSFYGQFYWYIHQVIDPADDGAVIDLSVATKMTTSRNAALMGSAEIRKKQYFEKTALQIRLFMTAYMLSFLTNTLLVVISDNMAVGTPSRSNLLLQSAVVAPQGILTGLVYMRTATKSLVSSYVDAFNSIVARYKPEVARQMVMAKEQAVRAKVAASNAATAVTVNEEQAGAIEKCWNVFTVTSMMPVAVWVWTPMEFLSENFGNRALVFAGLILWSAMTMFPFYQFSVVGKLTANTSDEWYENAAHLYVLAVVIIAALAVWNNRYRHDLLMIEGPIRRKGVFGSIGQGYRFSSVRNFMGAFTALLEFYQTWGLAWSATRMNDLYGIREDDAPVAGNLTDIDQAELYSNGTWVNGTWTPPEEESLKFELSTDSKFFQFWCIVGMCVGWAILYSLPVVITTTTIGYRTLAFNWTEKYRKYLWFMSGAGFLTIMKALFKTLFCVKCVQITGANCLDSGCPASACFKPGVEAVVLLDYSMVCWSTLHLQMVAISLLCFVIFFPSASLTTLFRYGNEDDRGVGGIKGPRGAMNGDGPPANGGYQDGNGGFTRIKPGPDVYEQDGEKYMTTIDPITQRPMGAGCNLGGEDTRWVHLWRRVEYMVKALWVFTGLRFSEYGNWACGALLIGSTIIATANWFMQPSNLKFVGRNKLQIHLCNIWTTCTCFWANSSQNSDLATHRMMLFPGWVFIIAVIWGYEVYLFNHDVFKKEIGDEENIQAVAEECLSLRKMICFSQFINRWGHHYRIVRLLRLCEHPDVEVQRSAFKALAILAQQDHMTTSYSFFAMLCPTDPGVFTLLDAIEGHPDAEIRNYATRVFTTFLQMNAGNRYGLLVTFHSKLQEADDEKGNIVASLLVDYALEADDLWHKIDAVQMLLEMGNSDSNDLPAVAENAMPLLSDWIENGNVVQQYIACHLVMKTANRFDLAGDVMSSDAIGSLVKLFTALADQYDTFSDDGKNDGFRASSPMSTSFSCPVWSLPAKYKSDYEVDSIEQSSDEDNFGYNKEATLNKEQLLQMQGDIMLMAVQTMVDLSFAASADGRKRLMDEGGLEMMKRCLGFKAEKGLKSAGENSIHNRLQFEAFRAANTFLCGPFNEDQIEIDDDYKTFHGALSRFAEESPLDEFVFDGLTPVQRRKAHIISEYLDLDHESDGMQAVRKVTIRRRTANPNMMKTSSDNNAGVNISMTNPMMESLVEEEDFTPTPVTPSKAKMGGFGTGTDKASQAVYEDNWKRVAQTGIAKTLLSTLGKNFTKLSSVDVQFQVVDVILLLTEHDLITADELPDVRTLMMTALAGNERGLAVMGAKGMEVIIVRDGLYVPYGTRIEAYGSDPRRLLTWVFKMTYWCIFWKTHSGSMAKMFESDELL